MKMEKECIKYRRKIFGVLKKRLKYRGFQNVTKTISENDLLNIEKQFALYEAGDTVDLIT